MNKDVIGLASDHAGFQLKQYVKQYLDANKYEYKDYGCYDDHSCDYPIFGHALAKGIEMGECSRGIGVCGTGEGISMTLNKHQGIRAGLCWCPEVAEMSRKHNDANVLVMPGRYLSEDMAKKILDVFFHTDFEGGRHERRVKQIPI